jgi:hypothetical protein
MRRLLLLNFINLVIQKLKLLMKLKRKMSTLNKQTFVFETNSQNKKPTLPVNYKRYIYVANLTNEINIDESIAKLSVIIENRFTEPFKRNKMPEYYFDKHLKIVFI